MNTGGVDNSQRDDETITPGDDGTPDGTQADPVSQATLTDEQYAASVAGAQDSHTAFLVSPFVPAETPTAGATQTEESFFNTNTPTADPTAEVCTTTVHTQKQSETKTMAETSSSLTSSVTITKTRGSSSTATDQHDGSTRSRL